jgi:hypothetical protein
MPEPVLYTGKGSFILPAQLAYGGINMKGKAMVEEMCDGKCHCNILLGLVSVVLLAVGVFAFVHGFGMNPTLFWYAGGLLLLIAGKVCKKRAICCGCAGGCCGTC